MEIESLVIRKNETCFEKMEKLGFEISSLNGLRQRWRTFGGKYQKFASVSKEDEQQGSKETLEEQRVCK